MSAREGVDNVRDDFGNRAAATGATAMPCAHVRRSHGLRAAGPTWLAAHMRGSD